MLAHQLEWTTELPGSDIAVARFMVCNSPCFETQFRELDLGEDMHTTGVAECMLETEADGTTRILQRTAKGYVAYGKRTWVAVSFPLPAGMSGSPAVCTIDGFDHVVGVLVGQTRTEIIEDLIEEITEATPGRHTTRVERVSRVEYVSRVELLAQYKDYKAQEFGGITFGELIANEIPSRP
jgi:hypothetical protein